MSDLQVIRVKELASILSVHKSTIYRWLENDQLPIPKVQVGPGVVGFLAKDVEAHLTKARSDSNNS